jgi:HEAT repeat protein/CheY-like chemotaxis protein
MREILHEKSRDYNTSWNWEEPMKRGSFRAKALTAGLVALLLGLLSNQAFAQGSVEALFEEGKEAFLQGDYGKAIEKFEEVMAQKPDHKLAYSLRQTVGYQFFIELLVKDGKFKIFAQYILSRAETHAPVPKKDPELIKKLVNDLRSDDYLVRYRAIHKLTSEIGDYAAPALVERLGDETNDKWRTYVIIAMTQMGSQVVLPLLETLSSDTVLQRQNAAVVLGNIGDLRALADLKRLWEDPKEVQEVKEVVKTAIRKIIGKDPETDKTPAKEYFYQKALMYFQNHPSIIKNYDNTWVVWRWKKDGETQGLVMDEVPRWLYNYRLAEEACFDALDIDYTFTKIWPILILTSLGEYNEALIQLQEGREEQKDKLKELVAKAYGGYVTAFAGGPAVLYKALRFAVNTNEVPLAVASCDAIRAMAEGNLLPGGKGASVKGKSVGRAGDGKILLDALKYPDKRLRYAAACAIVAVTNRSAQWRKSGFAAMKTTIRVLIEALGESGARSVLVISGDSDKRNSLVQELIEMNYFAFGSASKEAGYNRAKRFPSDDLFIIDMDIAIDLTFNFKAEDVGVEHQETFLEALRADFRTREVPIFILCKTEDLPRAQKLFSSDAAGFITYPINVEDVRLQLQELFAKFPPDDKGKATKISADAAAAIASIDPVFTSFPLKSGAKSRELGDIIAALVAVIEKRPDEVRVPAFKALARFGTEETIPAITRVIASKEANSPEVRSAACLALAGVFSKLKSLLGKETDTFRVLLDAAGPGENSLAVRAAAGTALGKAPLDEEAKYLIFKKIRMHK